MATALHQPGSKLLRFTKKRWDLSSIGSELMYGLQQSIEYLKSNDSILEVRADLRNEDIDSSVLLVCFKFFEAVCRDLLKLQLSIAVSHWRRVHKEWFKDLIMPLISRFGHVLSEVKVAKLDEWQNVLYTVLTKIEIVYKCDSLLTLMESNQGRHIHVVLNGDQDKEFADVFVSIDDSSISVS